MTDSAAASLEDTGGISLAHLKEISGRIGTNKDGLPARTFHCAFSAVKIGDEMNAGSSLDYALREGKWGPGEEADEDAAPTSRAERADDAVYVAGKPDAVREAAELIERSARVRRGPNAERVLVKQIVELPSDTSRERWNKAADAIAGNWIERGHPAVAVVHFHGDEHSHPHLHVLAAARRIVEDDQGRPTVDRTSTLWSTKQELRDERHNVAKLINEACKPQVELHGGRLEDTNIHRPAKTRLSQAAWHRRKQRRRNPARAAAAQTDARMRAVAARTRRTPSPGRRAEEVKTLTGEYPRGRAPGDRRDGVNKPIRLSGPTRDMLAGVCRRTGASLDLDTRTGQDLAFALRHVEEGRTSDKELANIRAAIERAVAAAPRPERGDAEVPPDGALTETADETAGDAGNTIEATSGVSAGEDAEARDEPGRPVPPCREELPSGVEMNTFDDGRIVVTSPFDESFRQGARKLDGKWSHKDKRWTFEPGKEAELHELAREVFGDARQGMEPAPSSEPGPTSTDIESEMTREGQAGPAGDGAAGGRAASDPRDVEPEVDTTEQQAQIAAAQERPVQEAPALPSAGADDSSPPDIPSARVAEARESLGHKGDQHLQALLVARKRIEWASKVIAERRGVPESAGLVRNRERTRKIEQQREEKARNGLVVTLRPAFGDDAPALAEAMARQVSDERRRQAESEHRPHEKAEKSAAATRPDATVEPQTSAGEPGESPPGDSEDRLERLVELKSGDAQVSDKRRRQGKPEHQSCEEAEKPATRPARPHQAEKASSAAKAQQRRASRPAGRDGAARLALSPEILERRAGELRRELKAAELSRTVARRDVAEGGTAEIRTKGEEKVRRTSRRINAIRKQAARFGIDLEPKRGRGRGRDSGRS